MTPNHHILNVTRDFRAPNVSALSSVSLMECSRLLSHSIVLLLIKDTHILDQSRGNVLHGLTKVMGYLRTLDVLFLRPASLSQRWPSSQQQHSIRSKCPNKDSVP